jgi:hypothetical protein
MTIRSVLLAFPLALVLSGAAVTATGCSHGKTATVVAGQMPDGEVWTGVYFNPVYGYMHLIDRDGKIWGRYKWANQSHWGEINGTADGNVVHYDWTEYDTSPVAPGEARKGHGYWVYKLNKDHIGALTGEFGLDDDETGAGKWEALKMKNMKADPDSVKADVKADVPIQGDTWDSAGDGGSPPPPDNSGDPDQPQDPHP